MCIHQHQPQCGATRPIRRWQGVPGHIHRHQPGHQLYLQRSLVVARSVDPEAPSEASAYLPATEAQVSARSVIAEDLHMLVKPRPRPPTPTRPARDSGSWPSAVPLPPGAPPSSTAAQQPSSSSSSEPSASAAVLGGELEEPSVSVDFLQWLSSEFGSMPVPKSSPGPSIVEELQRAFLNAQYVQEQQLEQEEQAASQAAAGQVQLLQHGSEGAAQQQVQGAQIEGDQKPVSGTSNPENGSSTNGARS